MTGCATVALSAGDISDGAASPDGGGGAATGFTVKATVCVMPPDTAVMVAVVEVVTALVVTVKVALVAPAGTVTLAGTVTAVELSDSVTTAPPDGAGALNLTVTVMELPPTTLVWLSETAEIVGPTGGGVTVIDVNWNRLSRAAVS